jgi:outer membrane protein assembly factor BamB
MRRALLVVTLAAAPAACQSPPEQCGAWLQWAGDPAHHGASCSAAQPMSQQLGELAYDPFLVAERADADGEILVHYQVPLIAGDDVYVMVKAGRYTPCDPPIPPSMTEVCHLYRLNSQVWSEQAVRWQNGQIQHQWTFETDWKPEPYPGFEPMFQPAVAGDRLYVPMAGGALAVLDRHSGALLEKVQPFGGSVDPDTYVASPVTADASGNIFYTTLTLDHDDPWGTDAHGSLVRFGSEGSLRAVPLDTLVVGAPGPSDLCRATFNRKDNPLPWPPPPNPDGTPALPPLAPCGTQRPGVNAAPAIGEDGTIFVVSRAHLRDRESYLVAVHPDLTPRWATSLKGTLADGCGVLVPSDGDDMDNRFDCRPGTALGVDPSTNEPPAARVIDDSSSSPVALPDGGVLYGAYTGYNAARGHLVDLDADGHLRATYDFGWDTTPAVVRDGPSASAGYSIVLKDNHYGVDADGYDLGPYYITRLDAQLVPQWRFLSTNTKSCMRVAGQSELACTDDHPHGFEWCINAPAVDRDGNVYVNSEDGYLYAIDRNGQLREQIFLDMAVGAAYTPLSIDGRGRVYTLNDGRLSVVGQ